MVENQENRMIHLLLTKEKRIDGRTDNRCRIIIISILILLFLFLMVLRCASSSSSTTTTTLVMDRGSGNLGIYWLIDRHCQLLVVQLYHVSQSVSRSDSKTKERRLGLYLFSI
eukprot:GHVU01230857.1.p1 GENE.GHVU01230857.1~~GHVU01230857.1.p1  ORF type:complete len:113 (-),score=10.33 GHVU01230857.1:31-369(-)